MCAAQLPATNWSYSVAMCQFIHTCLTKGGAAEHFDDKEMLVLLLCALSYGIGHKEHEGGLGLGLGLKLGLGLGLR